MARTQRSIQAFARISKPSGDATGLLKRKQTADEEPFEKAAKKTKFEPVNPLGTPKKVIKQVLSNLKLSTSSPSALRSSKRKRAASPEIDSLPTPVSNNDVDDESENEFPEELEDIKSLQRSFLKALSLHYAHNGCASPVDIRLLSPVITKTWGKRKVLLEDIRTCLGILHGESGVLGTTFTLSNYGNGKICLEMESRQRKRGVLAQAFDEAELNVAFDKQLEGAWEIWPQKNEVEKFIHTLPRAQILECSSYTKLKPSLAKGQQRLEQVLKPRSENVIPASERPQYRQFQACEKQATVQVEVEDEDEKALVERKDKENTTPPPPTANFRALSLLDRIQKKQELQAASLATRPTQAELDRSAALQRSEEMIQILELLATTKGPGLRASFPLPALIRSIQSSLKSPMSPEEIERCISVIGREVAPGYVEKKEFGSMKGVVVNRMFKPSAEKIRALAEAS
ncbi:uncharacterized protein PV09_01480 [Verruconis gallopava]|uniref:DNA replication factor Cdt1 C-terminal domain-containing protein n=1 Tax=Verruconis gallopava TaxID=253628 RepID=A0A0D1XXQ2_9PEZI|nr:uncharacterized protein PV09_01480 [Verruconis gallopava]KIW07516.1 hypothetical protein PV09_01480 [Verruconis gallopava]